MGETLGKRLWPGEKRAGEAMELGVLELGGWNADGKDFRIGVSPAMLNIGLEIVTIFTFLGILVNCDAVGT